MKVAILSDNHGYFGEELIPHLEKVDEIWHAGDMGDLSSIDKLTSIAPVVGVYGNVDNHVTRAEYPLNQSFEREGLKIFMTHIGGYPGRYSKRVSTQLIEERPDVYICGHSHICKVMRDPRLNLLHINPGAYGHHGFHQFRTFVIMEIQNGMIGDMHVVELGKRGSINDKK